MDEIVLTRDQSRAVDRRAIEEFGFLGLVLMENAGRGVVETLERLGIDGPVVVLCGSGNNAGDGFVIARHLEIRGHEVRVMLLISPEKLTGDALTNYTILTKTNVPIRKLTTDGRPIRQQLDELGTGAAWIVDAMLGTGARGEPRPPLDEAIDWLNDQPGRKLAVDVPSVELGEPWPPGDPILDRALEHLQSETPAPAVQAAA